MPKNVCEKSEYFLFKIRKKSYRKKGCFRLVFSKKCSSGHLNTALTTLPKNSMAKPGKVLLRIRQILKNYNHFGKQSFSSKWTETPLFCWRRKQFVHSCRNSFSNNLTFFHPKSENSYQTTFHARIIFLLKIYCRQVECSFVEIAENFPTTVRDFSTNIL